MSMLCNCMFMCLGAVIVVDCVVWYGMLLALLPPLLCVFVVCLNVIVYVVCDVLCGVVGLGFVDLFCV